MARRRTTSLAATIAVLVMLVSGLFAGPALALSDQANGGRGPQPPAQPGNLTSDFLCKSVFTSELRLSLTPSCPPNHQLIVISQELPFDYCYSLTTRQMRDDFPNNTCPRGHLYVVVDGTTSFFVCANPFTLLVHHVASPEQCTFGTTVFVIDLRGDLTKFACVEENLNDNLCDVIPGGGPQNEIRHLEPVEPSPFIDAQFRLEFGGQQTAILHANTDTDTSAAAIQAALESLATIGAGNVSVTAVDPGEFWTTAADVFGTPDDESTDIRVEFTGALGNLDITDPINVISVVSTNGGEEFTLIDGTAGVSPGLNSVMPGGAVQIFEATGATDPDNPATYGPEVTSGPEAVNAAGSFTAGNLFEGLYVVCADGTGSIAPSCELVTIAGEDVTIINNVDLPGTISAAITALGTDEVQTYDDFGSFGFVSGGTYTITFGADTTTDLQWDADAATVQLALNALTSINTGGGSVTVSGGPPGFGGGPPPFHGPPMVITFDGGPLSSQDLPAITIDSTNLTGSGGFFGDTYFVNPNLTDIDGSGATHTLTADARVSGGTFTLTYDNGTISSTTGPLDFDATVTEIETALNALASINGGGGSVTVVSTDPDIVPGNEPITKAPVEVSFSGVANSDVAGSLSVDNTLLE